MSSTIFSSAQRIISQVLSFLQSSSQGATTNLITDTFSAGIDNSTESIGEGFTIVPGSNNTSVNPSVNITGGGIAYNSSGNRIYISPSDTILYNASNPLITTNDGLGNQIATPQSTGCINVPVTQSSSNYLWVDYLAVINPTAFTLNSETNAKIFYQQTDGYVITVTTTNVPPDSGSVYLGSVTATGVAIVSSNISQVGRTYFNINPKMVPIITPFNNGSNRTPQYAQNTEYTLDAHIKAIGTGTGVSPTNPHNMSLADLGVGIFDTVQEHRILEHGNAIIAGVPGTPYPTLSAMAQSINIVDPGSDSLNIFALSSTEFAIINGTAFNTNAIFGTVPTNATVMFPATSGTYNVYWDSVSQVFGVSLTDISTDNTKLWLATVTYTFVGTGPLDHNALSALIDRRRVGSTTHLLQRWTNNSRPGDGSLQPQSGEFGYNLTSNVLEYWNGSSWIQPLSTFTIPVDGTTIDLNGSNELQVVPGGITDTQIAAGAVSDYVANGTSAGSAGTTLESTNITTSGGLVMVFASLTLNYSTAGSPTTLTVSATRGGTGIVGNVASTTTPAFVTENQHVSFVAFDQPVAGNYTYDLTYGFSLTPTGLSVVSYSFNVVELKR